MLVIENYTVSIQVVASQYLRQVLNIFSIFTHDWLTYDLPLTNPSNMTF